MFFSLKKNPKMITYDILKIEKKNKLSKAKIYKQKSNKISQEDIYLQKHRKKTPLINEFHLNFLLYTYIYYIFSANNFINIILKLEKEREKEI